MLQVGAVFVLGIGIQGCGDTSAASSESGTAAKGNSQAGAAGASSLGSHDSGPAKPASGGDTGTSSTSTSRPTLSDCLSEPDLPVDCAAACARDGNACAPDGCEVGGALAATVAFYADLQGCNAGRAILTELASCTTPFSAAAILISYGAVRCCCE